MLPSDRCLRWLRPLLRQYRHEGCRTGRDEAYTKLPRLYSKCRLNAGSQLAIESEDVHYLLNVMRLQEGNSLRIFNGEDGEYLCRIRNISNKKRAKSVLFDVVSLQRTCSDTVIPTTLLLAAPLKKPRLKTMIEKATELNMHAFIPLITQNTNNTVDSSGLITCMIQATEQSERMSPPLLHSPIHLASDFVTNDDCILLPQIASHPMYYYLICCARADNADSNAVSLPTALHCIRNDPAVSNMPLAVMVGPEGGFTDHELSQFSGKRNVTFVSLGHNVLRSETASLVSLGLIHMLERNCLNLH